MEGVFLWGRWGGGGGGGGGEGVFQAHFYFQVTGPGELAESLTKIALNIYNPLSI